MINKSKIFGMLFILFTVLFCIASGARAEKDVAGKTFFTLANIWYEHAEKIYSTNYHRGAILPVGTKVTVKNVDDREITFANDDGTEYRIVYVKKHNPGVTVWDHFDRYFSEKNPMAKGGSFHAFTKSEQDSIMGGTIKKDMSKDAVLMSYGYPPSIKTATLNSDRWVFMENRFITRTVQFKDGKVMKAK